MLADAGDSALPTPEELKDMAKLVQMLDAAESDIEHLNTLLSLANQRRNNITMTYLPDAMNAANLKQFTAKDGTKIELKPIYSGSTSLPKEEGGGPNLKALAWLKDNGHGGLVKHEFTVPFGKDSEEEAETLKTLLEKKGYDFNEMENVHPSTFKAWLKEQLEKGNPGRVPLELFRASVVTVATVKRPK